MLLLPLNQGFSFFEPCQHLVFCLKHTQPYFAREIVNESAKIPCTSNGYCFHWHTYVRMHELQYFCSVGSFVHRQWSPRLFALDTIFGCKRMHVALHLSHVHPAHHALKHFHAICVKMPRPLVPRLLKIRVSMGTYQRICFGTIHHIHVQLVKKGF